MEKKEVIIGIAGVALATGLLFKKEHEPHIPEMVEPDLYSNMIGVDVYHIRAQQILNLQNSLPYLNPWSGYYHNIQKID